jgi:hypothetical protein
MAGIGLILAWSFPGGLTGGQGFLLGFTLGILAPGIVTLYLTTQRTRQINLAREIEKALSKLQARKVADQLDREQRLWERKAIHDDEFSKQIDELTGNYRGITDQGHLAPIRDD